ncbi:IclR family transcriptional regulator [Microbacterium sp. UBA1612]|uniref:IclR family transcriptional regulator n=1 Tax=Microbacterium sp. UBA1612 TaxID=1946942 RepID=UPI00257A8D2F|nr:IclR family transcriptional regulator [Microbacterium sp. UBA1612]|tara:strand:- start:9168 stop:9938 length:771 start_codon:yes stop_codon:yes gene_type:complete
MPAKTPAPASPSRTLVRGVTLLEIVASNPDGIGVTEIATRANLDKGTVSRLLATLRQMGYVQQRATDRRFVLGSRCLWLAREYRSHQEELSNVARPFLAELRDSSEETVHLAIREENFVVFIAQEQPDRSIRVRSAVGSRLAMHRTAMGRALLAELDVETRDHLIAELEADAHARGEEIDVEQLRADVAEAVERGWAAVDRHDDVTRLAAAIVDSDGEPIAALTLSGPNYRVEPRIEDLGAQVLRTARALSAALAL